MPPHRTAAQPTHRPFDPYNSSATGHQRADNRLAGSTSWRASRTTKLSHQFGGGAGGGKRVSDTVGAGSKEFGRDGRKENGGWEVGAKGLRETGWQDVRGLFGGVGAGETKVGVERVVGSEKKSATGTVKVKEEREGCGGRGGAGGKGVQVAATNGSDAKDEKENEKKIFRGLCVYINGSTAPLVSDHKLKYLLAENGANLSIALGRRTVTHVILGTPNGSTVRNGAGGGLAATKIQKDISRIGGCGVKYVGVEWVLESIKAGKRLPEAQFSGLSIAAKGQKSVYGIFKRWDGQSKQNAATATEFEESTRCS